jgi:diguanylate cyclase (GGDEF)-like protein
MLFACCLALGLAVAGSAVVLLLHLRDRALAGAMHEQQSLALVLADQADRAFDAVEQMQNALLDRLSVAGISTPDGFRAHFSGVTVHDDLRSRIRSLPQLDAVTAIDSDGRLVNFSRYWPIPQVNVADRDYFRALVADPELQSFIGAPVPNRGTGTWTIYIARRVSGADGQFLGLILGAIELDYFERLYAMVTRNEAGGIALFRQDGTLLARHPRVAPNIGRSFAQGEVFRALATAGSRSVEVRQISRNDGQDRLIAAHRLSRYPLLVTTSTTVAAVLEDWRQQAAWLLGMAALLELGIITVGVLLLRRLRGQELLAEALQARAQAEAQLALAGERERADRELAVQHMRLAAALGNMSQALCMFDSQDRLVVANARLAVKFALEADAVRPGITFQALVSRARVASNLSNGDLATFLRGLRRLRQASEPVTHVRELSDGRALSINFQPMAQQGWLVTIEDITERRRAEARITHMAHHDALTGLPNRVLFLKRLSQGIARSRRGDPCAVLCLDLDHFKAVNDTLGHPVGDALLRAVTARLLAHVRETDTVARLGGDEFAIVQSSVEQPQDATALAQRLTEVLSEPFDLEGHQMVIGTSVGIAVVPQDGDDPHVLLKNADLALYKAKADGRGRYRCFEPEMDARMQARRALELDLRRALLLGEFEVYYQPLMQLRTNQVSGFEALVRWRHPERGLVSPADFVPLAEEIGLILPLGEWVLRQACRDAMTWPETVKVAVNLSPVQFTSRTLVRDVADALADSGLSPSRLELEITETVMLEDTDATLSILHELKALGVRIAMDDFGTGYSSLSYLRRFPFDKVKIDRSFIEELGLGGDCDAIVAAVTAMCNTLGMATVAEGVETQDQLQMLRGGQCSEVQGYLFSKPRPAAELMQLCLTLNAAGASANVSVVA